MLSFEFNLILCPCHISLLLVLASILALSSCFALASILALSSCFALASILALSSCFALASILALSSCFALASILALSSCFALASILALSSCFAFASILALSRVSPLLLSSFCPRVSPLLLSSLCPRVSPLLLSSLSALPSLLVFHPCVDSLSSLVSCPRSYSRILSVCLDLAFLVNLPVSGLRPSRAAERELFFASQLSRLVACDLTSVLRSLRTRSRASYVRWRTLAQPRCGGLSLSRAVTDRGSWPRLLKGQLHGLPG